MSGLWKLTANQGGSNYVTSPVKLSRAGTGGRLWPGRVGPGLGWGERRGRVGRGFGRPGRAGVKKLLTGTCPLSLSPQSPSD